MTACIRTAPLCAIIFLLISMIMIPDRILHAEPAPGNIIHVSQQPLTGITDRQFRTITEAVDIIKPGDTVIIHGGTYRESVTIEKSGTPQKPIVFKSAPAERVIVTGADHITDWKKESDTESIYSTHWNHTFTEWSKDNSYAAPAPIGRAEQVFVDAYQMHQVMKRELLSPGSFYVDAASKRLFIHIADNLYNLTPNDINRLNIEASARPMLWYAKGDYIQTKGIRFRYAANHAQMGAATFAGNNDIVENCIFERVNADGARFEGRNIEVRNCTFQDNGFTGFEACRAHNMLITGCLVRNNNTKNFDRGWGGAANKIVLSRNVIIEKSRFLENRGVGIWFDIGNENCVIRNCLIADNEAAGIFYEISYGLHVYDNVITGNGFAGDWGVSSGISLSSSPNCEIERNLIIGNAEGMAFREQYRTTPRINNEKNEVPIWNHDQIIRKNVFAYNGVQTWGWFAAGDGRHWPESIHKSAGKPVENNTNQPAGLTLEKLKLNMSDNIYYSAPGQKLLVWGPTWEDHREYNDLKNVQSELNLEKGSRIAPIGIAGIETRDFRVPSESILLKTGCYPKGQVPGVQLGILDR